MGIIDSIFDISNFNEPIIYKGNSELKDKKDALDRLLIEYPGNMKILDELNMVRKGLFGEDEVLYQLKKSNIGMYILRDVKLIYEDMTAQVDFVVLTPLYTYFIECKNLSGNIVVNEKGDFIIESNFNGRLVRKGMYSPLTQVENQRDIIQKIWESRAGKLDKFFFSKKFDYYRRVLVVMANKESLLDISVAPDDIKHKVLRADSLIRQIEYDFKHKGKDEVLLNKNQLENAAASYLDACDKYNEDWYTYYKNLFCNEEFIKESNLNKKLRDFRVKRATEMKCPPYYVFNNEELDKLVEIRPKTINELEGILSPIKIRVHGGEIIKIINGV